MSFIPAKVLNFVMQNTTPSAVWTGDNVWAGYPYQWTTTLAITPQPHGSPNTPTPYFYDGNDVNVGDYIITAGQGRVLKIVAISQKGVSSVSCTVEDENRQNTLQDTNSSGEGGIQDGEGLLFAVENGWPILHPLPDALAGALPPYFSADVIARFMRTRVDGANAVPLSEKGAPGGVATLDATTGQLPAAQIPPVALTETFTVASEVAMLVLDAQIGDIAIRTDANKTFILSQSDPSVLANWLEVLTPGGNLSTLGDVLIDNNDVKSTLVFNPTTGLWEDTAIDTLLDGGGF